MFAGESAGRIYVKQETDSTRFHPLRSFGAEVRSIEHNGSIATLEDWFDPARLEDDYVPTGFVGLDGPRPARDTRLACDFRNRTSMR